MKHVELKAITISEKDNIKSRVIYMTDFMPNWMNLESFDKEQNQQLNNQTSDPFISS